ncbi:hypothetical protein WN943_027699 [Citrus x changshan-huyou]
MRSEFDRDCEIGMLEENVLPLGSGLRAPIRGALGIILGHKTAGLNIFVGASKFLLHHVEEGLLNQRLLENVVTCDLKKCKVSCKLPYMVNNGGDANIKHDILQGHKHYLVAISVEIKYP